MDRGGTTGEHDAPDRSTVSCACADLGGRDRMGHDLGVHMSLTHPTGDELRVLGTEVDDENRVEISGSELVIRGITHGSVTHPDALGLLQHLALGLERGRHHDLGLLELLHGLIATGGHRRAQRTEEVHITFG